MRFVYHSKAQQGQPVNVFLAVGINPKKPSYVGLALIQRTDGKMMKYTYESKTTHGKGGILMDFTMGILNAVKPIGTNIVLYADMDKFQPAAIVNGKFRANTPNGTEFMKEINELKKTHQIRFEQIDAGDLETLTAQIKKMVSEGFSKREE